MSNVKKGLDTNPFDQKSKVFIETAWYTACPSGACSKYML